MWIMSATSAPMRISIPAARINSPRLSNINSAPPLFLNQNALESILMRQEKPYGFLAGILLGLGIYYRATPWGLVLVWAAVMLLILYVWGEK
jgi:hypothetical protein